MLRPFLLALIVVGAGASSVGEVTQPSDVATWRWQVATILDAQRGEADLRLCRLPPPAPTTSVTNVMTAKASRRPRPSATEPRRRQCGI